MGKGPSCFSDKEGINYAESAIFFVGTLFESNHIACNFSSVPNLYNLHIPIKKNQNLLDEADSKLFGMMITTPGFIIIADVGDCQNDCSD